MNLFGVLDISASGIDAQRKRVEVLAQNIANSETTRTPEGGPYRRQRVVFETGAPGGSFADTLAAARGGFSSSAPAGVKVSRVETDNTPPERRYLPDHPDAGEDGYVEFPGFNPVEDMVDLTASVRSFQANLAVVSAVKEMLTRTIEVQR